MPIIDLDIYLKYAQCDDFNKLPDEVRIECQKVAECFHNFGILIIKDPRVQFQDNEAYIDMMEDYFEQTGDRFYAGKDCKQDIKPETGYQVGATPEFIEVARDHSEKLKELDLARENQPESPLMPTKDAKWRFFWKIGQRADNASDDFPQVVPEGFPEWEDRMDKWGGTLFTAISSVAEMAAVGMSVPKDTFTKRMQGGAHLLAPTGSDLKKNDKGAVFAGFHYDISFMTIHGKSRYPGLSVWTRDWKKRTVKIPPGCLLVQAGLTFENITGGYVLAGFHEVIYTDGTKEVYEKKQAQLEAEGRQRTQWRVSSTMFTHFRFDVDAGPMQDLQHLYSKE